MLNFLKRLFNSDGSKSVARSRLHFVLVQDRTGLTSEEMAGFKEEMVNVINKYFVIDKDGFDIQYERMEETTTLRINSPVIVRRQNPRHIKAATEKEKAQKAATAPPEAVAEASNV